MDQTEAAQSEEPREPGLVWCLSPRLSGSLVATLFFGVTGLMLALVAVYGVRQHERIAGEQLSSLAAAAAALVDVAAHERLQDPGDTGNEDYQSAIGSLVAFHHSQPWIEWIYTMRVREGRLYYVLDTSRGRDFKLGRDPGLAAAVMEPVREFYLADEPGLLPALLAGRTHVDDNSYTAGDKLLRSAEAPVRDANGNVVAILGVDVEIGRFRAEQTSFLLRVAMAGVVSLLLSIAIGLLTTRLHRGQLEAMQRLEREGITDMLTGLSNRSFFQRSLDAAAAQSRRRGMPFALLVFDIDHFKRINDTWGHPAGDQVLRIIGERLRGQVRGDDVCCRIGGEEFALLMPGQGQRDAEGAYQRLSAAIRLPIAQEDESLVVTISGGVAVLEPAEAGTEELLRRADRALYAAKQTGRDRVVVADPRGQGQPA